MEAPSATEIAAWTEASPVLRLMPYPYFRGISIPWDPENSSEQDIYYGNAILSRKYGLDFPCGLIPYSSYLYPSGPHFFCGDASGPRTLPMELSEKPHTPVDAWPFLLSCYYRGWADHFHSWSLESCYPHSIVDPMTITLDGTGQKQ